MLNFSNYEGIIPTKLIDRVWILIIGRLLTIFLLFLGNWAWNSGQLKLSFDTIPRGLFWFSVTSVFLSVLYAFALRNLGNLYRQIIIQFSVDAILISWLVWVTGDVTSPYLSIYIVLICITGFFLGPRGTLLTALGSTIVFILISVSPFLQIIPRSSDVALPPISLVFQVISFHTVAFLVVGLLASQLAARHSRSNVKLEETAKSLADLKLLHQRIVESIRSGLVTTDLKGKIYTFNAAAEEITGLKSSEMRGKSIYNLLGNIEQPISVSLTAAQNDEQPPRFEIDYITPEGLGVRIGYGISPLFSEEGETTGLIITFQDLTEIRSMEESVRRKDRLAAVGRVGAGLAHEIRNPLGAMRGAIQVLQAGFPKESSQSALMDIVTRESDRLNKIITNFLDYARPTKSEFKKTDICEIIKDSVTLLRHSPDIKEDHQLKENLPPESIYVSADVTQLKQVFWNLSRNAIQAMPHGGTLSIGLNQLPNGRLQITFQDSGCGMSGDQVEGLFEPFSESTTGGTGLGLSIVYQIIRDHNGTINVKSKKDTGTTITIELPSERLVNQNYEELT